MQERLQKIISASGLMSRRAAEQLIAAGKVQVNGVPAELGTKADIEQDNIVVNGHPLLSREKKIRKNRVFFSSQFSGIIRGQFPWKER